MIHWINLQWMRKTFVMPLPELRSMGSYWHTASSNVNSNQSLPCPKRLLSPMYSSLSSESEAFEIPEAGIVLSGDSLQLAGPEASRVQALQPLLLVSQPRIHIEAPEDLHLRASSPSTVPTASDEPSLESFTWEILSESSKIHTQDLSTPYEAEMKFKNLPYLSLPIAGGTRSGLPSLYGFVKVIPHVSELGSLNQNTDWNNWTRRVQKFKSSEPNGHLHLRVHIYSASGLVPKHPQKGIANPAPWSLRLSVGNDKQTIADALYAAGHFDEADRAPKHGSIDNGKYSVWDFHSLDYGACPEFFRSYELNVVFPINTFLLIKVMEHVPGSSPASTLEEARRQSPIEYGHTFIDLEDRWYYPEWQQSVRFNPPIETRDLIVSPDPRSYQPPGVSCGKLKLRIELLTTDEITTHPFIPLVKPRVMKLELRLVLHTVTRIIYPDNKARNLYVKCAMLQQDEETVQESDAHYGSKDGSARFNWRYLFDVTVARRTRPQQVSIQVWHFEPLKQELLAHADLDITKHVHTFYERLLQDPTLTKEESGRFDLTFKPPLGHYASDAGSAELEWSLVTSDYAKEHAVGRGRDEPNRDPYLEPVTENRSITAMITGAFGSEEASTKLHTFKLYFWAAAVLFLALPVLYVLNQLKQLLNL
eukprot:Blabericola_migrator_1__242@NODE_1064_length_5554_cov_25_974121_g731_i0_p2_GENE_NODE_1064_length_5554_cov_25_974121_g731_i0NODE_1064_length_5554_cov_25_974121_g731_i0_p2_ORF_typecomplete_len648_score118_55Ferlin_C/PF16165_5/4_2e02Ferlin_C/PF16165_5/1_9e05C2/PF00168_30/1e02C2/PF00168_30/0_00065_NODE_1064_length_5554_cov_25_974121_g731_i010492992